MRAWLLTVALGAVVAAVAVACDSEETLDPVPVPDGGSGGAGGGGAGGAGGGPIEPSSEFDRYCGSDPWDQSLEAGAVGELSGAYLGVIDPDPPFPAGTLETMKIIPAHPFYVRTVRVAFGRGAGTARIRLMTTFGQGYPGGWPDIEAAEANLLPPSTST